MFDDLVADSGGSSAVLQCGAVVRRKVTPHNRTHVGGLLGEGKGLGGKTDRRDLWHGSGGKEREAQEGSAFIRGFGACAQGLMMCSIRTLRDSSAYAQRVFLVTAVEDPKGGPA